MEVVVELLQRWSSDNVRLVELLRTVCALMAHRRFAEAMVAAGGLQLLLDLPQNSHTAGVVRALFNAPQIGPVLALCWPLWLLAHMSFSFTKCKSSTCKCFQARSNGSARTLIWEVQTPLSAL